MNGNMVVFVDFETRSKADLKATGGRVYAEHDSTELLCAVAAILDGDRLDVFAWTPFSCGAGWSHPALLRAPRAGAPFESVIYHAIACGTERPPQPVLDALEAGAPLVAHNAHGFDRHVWSGLGLPEPRGGWRDTANLARRRGLPGKLEGIAKALYGRGKDQAGARILQYVAQPDGQGQFVDPHADVLEPIVRYCALDVLLLVGMWVDERMDAPHVDDPVLRAHEAILERGIMIDTQLVARFSVLDHDLGHAAVARAQRHGVTDRVLRSPKALCEWVRERGVDLPDVKAKTVRDVLRVPGLRADVADVLSARLELARVTGGKLKALLERTQRDGRYRDWCAYWGAGTGRWAGRGAQLQNFPRPLEGFDTDGFVTRLLEGQTSAAYDRLLARAKEWLQGEQIAPQALLGGLLRAVVRAPIGKWLVTVDLSQIEARTLLWLSGQHDALQVYIDGGDPYKVAAARIYGVAVEGVTATQRQAGKVAVLACGYGGGVRAVSGFAVKSGIDLTAAGVTAESVVEGWRDAHPKVAGVRTGEVLHRGGRMVVLRKGGMWRRLQRAVRRAVCDGVASTVYGCRFAMDGPHLVLTLPSGRPIVYRNARLDGSPGEARALVQYDSPRGFRARLYGGLVTENVVQAFDRDLIAWAIVRLERAGYRVVLHVHDEVVVEVDAPEQAEEVQRIVLELPEWAVGLPVDAKVTIGERWSK